MRKLEDDLGYVRSVVEGADDARSPAAISLLWAAICLVGFSLYDLRPSAIPLFWSIAGPAGGLLSLWIGWRFCRRVGQRRLGEARAHALHWLGMLFAVFLVVPLEATGRLGGDALAHVILVIVALGWFTAGVHLVRAYMAIGAVMALGYVALLAISSFTWTAVGVLIAVSLVVSVIVDRRRAAPRT